MVGPCKARLPRYFFNPRTRECELFFYGGCLGNKNNFVTKQACEEACKQGDLNVLSVCKLLTAAKYTGNNSEQLMINEHTARRIWRCENCNYKSPFLLFTYCYKYICKAFFLQLHESVSVPQFTLIISSSMQSCLIVIAIIITKILAVQLASITLFLD